MFSFQRILVTPIVLGISTVGLLGCGQQGALYLPTEANAANRATLPETLLRTISTKTEASASPLAPVNPSPPASTPVRP